MDEQIENVKRERENCGYYTNMIKVKYDVWELNVKMKRGREREGETEKGLAARKRERLIAGEVDNESTRERKVWGKK